MKKRRRIAVDYPALMKCLYLLYREAGLYGLTLRQATPRQFPESVFYGCPAQRNGRHGRYLCNRKYLSLQLASAIHDRAQVGAWFGLWHGELSDVGLELFDVAFKLNTESLDSLGRVKETCQRLTEDEGDDDGC